MTADDKAYSFSDAGELLSFVTWLAQEPIEACDRGSFTELVNSEIETVLDGTPSQCADFLVERFRKERGK